MKFRSIPYHNDKSTFDELCFAPARTLPMCGHMSAHQQALYSTYSPSILVPFSLLVLLCKGFSVHKYMMVRANPTHSTKSLTFWTRLCLILSMRVMRGYYGGKGGGGGGVAMPSQYCCVFASLLLLRHARIMPWCHFIFGVWYFRIFSMLVWSFCFCTGFGGRQQDRPPTSKGWTKGGGGW